MITSEMLASDEFQTFLSKVKSELTRKNHGIASFDLSFNLNEQRMVYYVMIYKSELTPKYLTDEERVESGVMAVLSYHQSGV